MSFYKPKGLGLGINSERLPDPTHGWHRANNALQPAWSHSWGRLFVGPNYMPSIFPEAHGIVSASELSQWRDGMIAAGARWNELFWQICNEPWGYHGVSALDMIGLIKAQDREFDRAGIKAQFVVINENINDNKDKPISNYDMVRKYYEHVRQYRLHVTLGIHVWEMDWNLLNTIENFFGWWAGYGDWSTTMPIIITECGPGSFQPMSKWLDTMPIMYSLLDRRHPVNGKKMVHALAPFCAYPKVTPGLERHPGFLSVEGVPNALGEQYLAAKRHFG